MANPVQQEELEMLEKRVQRVWEALDLGEVIIARSELGYISGYLRGLLQRLEETG